MKDLVPPAYMGYQAAQTGKRGIIFADLRGEFMQIRITFTLIT